MNKKSLFVGIVLLLLASSQVSRVVACSGYPYFGVDDLPTMDLLVRATVLETDDRGFNAIIRVEAYYKGEGERLLTVMRYSPALSSGALVRGYDTSCLYAGRGHHWLVGSQGYFGLRSNGDGTFTDENGGTAHFYPVNGVIQYQEGATEGYAAEFDEPKTISEDDFIDLMLAAGSREKPVQPTTDHPQQYPLKRFLNITTEKGTRYQVNPDRSILRLPDDAPIAISPDGAHVAFQIDDDTIALRYIWTEYSELVFWEADAKKVQDEFQVAGQAIRFANDSNLAAVWNAEQLTVVMISNDGMYNNGYGNGMRLNQVAQVELSPLDDPNLPVAQWSADSTTLVWQDGRGLWMWDLYDSAEPTLLKTAGKQPLLDVSRHGNYVRYGTPQDWTLLEVATGRTFPNTLISPSEQILILFDPRVPAYNQENSCTPPLRDTCSIAIEPGTPLPPIMFPYQMNMMGLVYCSPEDESCRLNIRSWHPAIVNYSNRWSYGITMSDVRQIAYDVQYDLPAILIGDYNLYFDFYSDLAVEEPDYRPYLDILELEDKVDAPIAHIEWGQPIFYDEYLLTTTEYLTP